MVQFPVPPQPQDEDSAPGYFHAEIIKLLRLDSNVILWSTGQANLLLNLLLMLDSQDSYLKLVKQHLSDKTYGAESYIRLRLLVHEIMRAKLNYDDAKQFISLCADDVLNNLVTGLTFRVSKKMKQFLEGVPYFDDEWFQDLAAGKDSCGRSGLRLTNSAFGPLGSDVGSGKLTSVNPIVGHIDLNNIYQRECYSKLMQLILNHGPKSSVCIGGNPGNGKSTYCYIVFSKLISSKSCNVLLVRESTDWMFYNAEDDTAAPGYGYETMPNSWRENDGCWLLLDGSAPSLFLAKRNRVVVFASPDRNNYDKFIKQTKGIVFYMPDWSLEEVHKYLDLCIGKNDPIIDTIYSVNVVDEGDDKNPPPSFNTVIKEAIESRFEIVGGKLRLLVNRQTAAQLKQMLYAALDSISSEHLSRIEYLTLCGETPSVAYSIVPHETNDFKTFEIAFCSSLAANKAFEYLIEREKYSFHKFYSLFQTSESSGSLRGVLFEKYVHHLIANGRVFPIRRLEIANAPLRNNKKKNAANTSFFSQVNNSSLKDLKNIIKSASDVMKNRRLDEDQTMQIIKFIPKLRECVNDVERQLKISPSTSEDPQQEKKEYIVFAGREITHFKYGDTDAILNSSRFDGYLIPTSPTYPTIDSFAINNFMITSDENAYLQKFLNEDIIALQITISETHDYNVARLLTIQKSYHKRKELNDVSASTSNGKRENGTGKVSPLKFAFVVPIHLFDSYTYQYKDKADEKIFHQYVIGIPMLEMFDLLGEKMLNNFEKQETNQNVIDGSSHDSEYPETPKPSVETKSVGHVHQVEGQAMKDIESQLTRIEISDSQ